MLKTKEKIEKWLDKMKIQNYSINEDLTVDVKGNVNLANKGLAEIPIQFRKVLGNFDCSNNSLRYLEWSPKIVAGYFDCSGNELISLEGSPEIVEGDFNCEDNELSSLKGGPSIVNGFYYAKNNSINSLEHLPLKVKEELVHDGIISLRILPLTSLAELQKRNDILHSVKILKTEFEKKETTKNPTLKFYYE